MKVLQLSEETKGLLAEKTEGLAEIRTAFEAKQKEVSNLVLAGCILCFAHVIFFGTVGGGGGNR